MPMCDDLGQPPPSAQSSSRPVHGNGQSVSALVPRRRHESVLMEAGGSRPASSSPGPDAHHRLSSSMMQCRHDPSSSHAYPAFNSSRANLPQTASPSVAVPAPRSFFDPWNSSSTGHQRAENRLSGSTSWRSSRNLKLGEQYRGGLSGGKRVADTVGAGSEDFGKDARKANGGWEKGARGLRTDGQKSLVDVWGASKASTTAKKSDSQKEIGSKDGEPRELVDDGHSEEPISSDTDPNLTSNTAEKQVFQGLCFYLNGSTAPLISDHKLKHLLAAHGANYSISLGRRTVTHVILGTGCGGGLAGSKLHKEITKKGGKSVKFITADWVLSSIAASKRLPESHFAPLKLAPKGQSSVFPPSDRPSHPLDEREVRFDLASPEPNQACLNPLPGNL